jgi:hypothetical protein
VKAETKIGKQLQSFNRWAGITHLIQAVALFVILNDETTIPVITRFFGETPEGIRPVSETLFEFPIALIGPIFLFLSAIAHLLISSSFLCPPLRAKHRQGHQPSTLVGIRI